MEQISVFALAIPSAVLFHLINHYKTIINCSAKPVTTLNSLKAFVSGDWISKQMSLE